MAFRVGGSVAILYLLSAVAFVVINGPLLVTGASVRRLTSFQKSAPKYAFECTNAECSRRQVSGFGKPVTWYTWSGSTYGQWMVDPSATCGSIYVIPSYAGQKIYQFDSMAKLKARKHSAMYNLPRQFAGTGAVVLNGSLYYNQLSQNTLIRMRLSSRKVVAAVSLKDAYYHNNAYYGWGGYTDIDFAVSETGLYVIYGSKRRSGKMAVSKLNPSTLAVEKTAYLNVKKLGLGNCFIVCATLHCTASYSARKTTISVTFDLNRKVQLNSRMPFINSYGYNSMIDYNPADRQLYAWDNTRFVTYDVLFKKSN